MKKRINLLFIGLGLLFVTGIAFTLASAEEITDDIQVNTYSKDQQQYPSVAMDSSGNLVITWESSGQDGDSYGVYAQKYDGSGNPVGSEFQVNTYTTNSQRLPSIAMDANGNFVITWMSLGQDGDSYGVYAQMYDSSGTPVGSEFQVNTYTTSDQQYPSVAMDSTGNFVITWTTYGQDGDSNDIYPQMSNGIYAQMYDSSGTPVGSEFQVNTYTTKSQWLPSIAMDANGNFVITWMSLGQDGDSYGIYAQMYDSSGTPVGSEFQVNTYTTSFQEWPSVAMDSSGNFVITWSSVGQDGSSAGVYAQRYDSSGTSIGSEFQVPNSSVYQQSNSSVVMDSNGNFVITWSGFGQEGDSDGYGIYARRYDSFGNPIDSEFQVNTYTADHQKRPSVAMDSNGSFVITWMSSGQDGDDLGVFMKLYQNQFDIQVNTYTTDDQGGPSVAMNSSGNFVIAWTSFFQDAPGYGVYAQMHDGSGNPVGSEFQVNTYTTSDQQWPSVAMDPYGNFVVTWTSYIQDGSFRGVYAQMYDSSGNPVDSEFRVNTYTTGYQARSSVAMDSSGNFVITWHNKDQDGDSFGVYAQMYDGSGNPVGSEFQVNTYTTESPTISLWLPSIAMDANGNFVITWMSLGQDGDSYGVYAQMYDSSGTPVGSEFQVNTYTTSDQEWPSVAMDPVGNFVITWTSTNQDGDRYGVYAQKYDSSGNPVGSEFRVNTYTWGYQDRPSVAMDSSGNFVITWHSTNQDGDRYGVYAQKYDSSGNPVGPEFQVNTYSKDQQQYPSVAMDSSGNLVITWESNFQDGDSLGVFMKLYQLDRDGDGIWNENDNCPNDIGNDSDVDGFCESDGDCNDNDAIVNPGINDANCDNIDNDCDGWPDEHYIATLTTCDGIGACANNEGQLICQDGSEIDTCDPYFGAAADDATCDGVDDDCDGFVDNDCIVNIPDENLKNAIMGALGLTSDPTIWDMLALTSLAAQSSNIVDLTGLEYAENLTNLNLYNNQISDISPLAGLINLQILFLNNNQISDITPLTGLINLSYLVLNFNQISDISPLAGLINLEMSLALWGNQISDISPLAGLINLQWLILSYNQIIDISPLAGLISLENLFLSYNQIVDISTLTGITSLYQLQLINNQLNWDAYCTYIPLIETNNPGLTNFSYDPNPTPFVYPDNDGDGFGDPSTETDICAAPAGYVLDNTDCDDSHATANPDVTDDLICDGVDDDCDGAIDEDCNTTPPEMTTPGDVIAESPDGSDITITFTVTANDLVDGEITPNCSPVSGSLFAIGAHPVTCTAEDYSGNVATAVFYVIVTTNPDRSGGDTIPPDTGGTVSTPDDSVQVDIPPDALANDTYISIAETGTSFELTSNLGNGTAVYGVTIQPDGTVFNTPITITFTWQDENNDGKVDGTNIKEENLIITKDNVAQTSRCKDETGPVETTGAECNTAENYFKLQVSSLSEFTLAYIDDQGPVTSSVIADPNPVEVNMSFNLTATVDDTTTGGTVISDAEYSINGGGYSAMTAVDQSFDSIVENVEEEISGRSETGVYEICVRGWDIHGNVPGDAECILLPVYDPDGGFVTGGGWIMSPEGAYTADQTLTGKANFGFVSKYKKGATIPTGTTEFQFKMADLNFHSESYEWLVVAGAGAKFKGVGTINGEGEYSFILTAIDADINKNDVVEVDRFRIRIWTEDELGTETVIYDNGLGDDSDDATTEIGGGSIVIHTGKGK